MKRTTTLISMALLAVAVCSSALAESGPKIQFDKTVYDFGKTTLISTVSGVFRFTNTGDATLKVESPKPSCGCTIAELKPDTLNPGESGELAFTLNLGVVRAVLEKHIAVKSNDPKTPEVSLTIKADYTPLYELAPMTLAPLLAFGVNETNQITILSRNDGKPLQIGRLDSSKPWITATLEPSSKTNETTARIRVAIQRDGTPRRFNEYVHIYTVDQTNIPVTSIYVSGEVRGEVSLLPEALYWSITGSAPTTADNIESMMLRRVAIRSATGKPFLLKNPQSTIKGIKVELVSKEAGKSYELVARLDDVPASTVSGSVSFETSVAEQPKIEVPVIVNVFKP